MEQIHPHAVALRVYGALDRPNCTSDGPRCYQASVRCTMRLSPSFPAPWGWPAPAHLQPAQQCGHVSVPLLTAGGVLALGPADQDADWFA